MSVDGLADVDDLFHCVNVAGPLLGLHLVKKKEGDGWLGDAICKAAS